MIYSLDSVTPPSTSQIAQARALGFSLWAGGFAGPYIAYDWSDADFQRVLDGGLQTLAYCSGYSEPEQVKARGQRLGIKICLDVEGGIRPDGSWVQTWLGTSGAGLYGNLPVHKGRTAAFHILADYVDTNPGATWLAGAGSFRPAGPCGWQWHGTTSLFGLAVDKANLDDWFAPTYHGVSTGSAGGFPLALTDDQQTQLYQMVSDIHGSFGTAPGQTIAELIADLKAYDVAINAVTLARLEQEILKIPTQPGAAAVDLSPVLAALNAVKAKTDKDLA